MKLKKLLSVAVASAVAFVYMCGTAVTASAALFSNINTVFTGTEYGNLDNFIYYSNPTNGQTLQVTVKADENYSLPTIIDYDDIKRLGNLSASGVEATLRINVTDPATGTEYAAFIKGSDVHANASKLSAAGKINVALSFEPTSSELRLYVRGYDGSVSDLGLPISYRITNAFWAPLLTKSGVPTNSDLSYYSISGTKMGEVGEGHDANFIIENASRTGVYFEETENDTNYITKKEAVAYARALLLNQIGLTEAQIDGTNPDFTNLKEYFDDALAAIKKKMTDDYVDKTTIDGMIENYLDKNKDDLVDAVIGDSKLDQKIADKIYEVLGNDVTIGEQQALVDYINDAVAKEVATQVGTYETPSNLILTTVNKAVDAAVEAKVDVLKNDILNAITGGQSVSDFVASLKGEQGQQGIPGTPGENFEDWVVNRYGSEENFIQYIVSRVSTGVNDGKSAYDLALDSGYVGTLSEWLESLKGKDGKSAYQIAVDLGFVGTEQEWLETLGSDEENDVIESEEPESSTEEVEETEDASDSIYGDDGEDPIEDEVNGTYEDLEDYEDEEGPDPDSEPVEEPPLEDYETEDGEYDDEDYSDDVTLDEDTPKYPFNPATGVTIGILLPVAAVGSILLAKKGKRKRGRR